MYVLGAGNNNNERCRAGRRIPRVVGPDPELVKYVWFEDAGSFAVLEHDTHSGSAYGHANSKSTISVGAASWYATGAIRA